MESQKRILIVTQYFYPENFRINELAFELVKEGYYVEALVGIPNYPGGKFFKGYNIFRKRRETINGVKIYRVFQIPRGIKTSYLRLSLNYISYAINATLWVLFYFVFKKKYDAIISFEPSPITQIIPAIILGKIRHTKVISWIQDIWPDSVVRALNDREKKIVIPLLSAITEFVYRNSDNLLISSPEMKDLICREKDYSDKIEYVPNWCEDFQKGEIQDISLMPSGFNLVMAGNINGGLGIDELIKFIEIVNTNKEINIIFIGRGPKKEYLEEYCRTNNLTNVFFLGMFPFEMMPSFYAKADAMLLTLAKRKEKHLNVTIPSRLQSYLSAGKPIFAMVGSGAGDVIKKANCGFVAGAGEYEKLASYLLENYKNVELLKELGHNSRQAFEQEFTIQIGVKHFKTIIDN